MKKEEKDNLNKWMIFGAIVIIGILAFLIVRPMLKILVGAALIGYIFLPLYKELVKIIKSRVISALIIISIMLIVSAVTVFTIANSLASEFSGLYIGINNITHEIGTSALEVNCSIQECSLKEKIITTLQNNAETREFINKKLVEFSSLILNEVRNIALKIPGIILSLFFILFLTFFILIDGDKISRTIYNFIPLRKKHKKEILKELKKTTDSVLFGQVIISLIQGATGSIGILLFSKIWNIPHANFITWGILMAAASLIPLLGTGLIWIPLGIANLIRGLSTASPNVFWYGISVFMWGAIAVANIDALIRPKLVGERANLHPIIVLISVFGGLSAFGFIGIFVGPIIVSSLIKLITIYQREYLK